jgi:hypothetical protein
VRRYKITKRILKIRKEGVKKDAGLQRSGGN